MNRIKEAFKNAGLKFTPQRVLIYKLLLNNKDHPSADNIYQKIHKKHPNISFDTVHRTLLSFAEIGLVRLVEGYGDAKRFDPDINNHHHMRCLKCGKIMDFQNTAYDNLKEPAGIEKQFKVISKKVVLEGYCKKCSK
ncbi:MAG: transcriptional repressor [Elusimicrobia bacterium]|nr:transcriptional repressor [Candidatus Liberimonas magnetica]